jgi:hypothetical protein
MDNSTSTAQFEHFMAGKKLAIDAAVVIFLCLQPSLLPAARQQTQAPSWRSGLPFSLVAAHSTILDRKRVDLLKELLLGAGLGYDIEKAILISDGSVVQKSTSKASSLSSQS